MAYTVDLTAYYSARAAEFEDVYLKPERQPDLALLREVVVAFARDRAVIEVTCGTGYWTRVAARTARSVFATDIAEAPLDLARANTAAGAAVQFDVGDALQLDLPRRFNAGLAGFLWSHITHQDIARFLDSLHDCLTAGSRVLIFDNRFVPDNSTPVHRRDADGNTFQLRTLRDGSQFEVLKNYPDEADVRSAVASAGGEDIEFTELEYYWYATYSYSPQPSRDRPAEATSPLTGR